MALLTSGRNAQKQMAAEQARLNTELEDYARLAAEVAAQTKAWADNLTRVERSSKAGVLGNKSQIQARLEEMRANNRSAQIARERSAALQGKAYGLNQVPAGGQLFPGGNTMTAQPGYRAAQNAAATYKQAAEAAKPLLQQAQQRTILEGKSLQVVRNRTNALREQAAIDANSIAILRQQNAERVKAAQLDERALTVARRQTQLADLRNKKKKGEELQGRVENTLVSGAFPLLFGAGPLATLGGFAGGALGGKNPMIGVFTSAIGQMVDQFAAAAIDMGKSLRDPITNFQKIKDAGLLASKSQEYYISKLIEVGRITEATAVVQQRVIELVGRGGANDMTAAGAAADKLSKAWAELNLQMQAAISGPLAELLNWITSVVRIFGESGKAGAGVKDLLAGLSPAQQAAFQKEMLQNNQRYGTSPKALQEEARIMEKYRGQAKPVALTPAAIAPEAKEQARKAAEAQADAIKSAYREAFQLQRQAADIGIAAAEQRRKVESDIFAKNQEAARLEIDNARKAAQLRIESSDLALRKQFSGSQGLTEELLNGVRAFISARRSGEADIAQKRRQLEVTLADINKATADYIYEQAKSRLQLERQIEDYKMAAADYQLKVARQIQQETAIGAAGAAGTGPAASVATGAFASLSRLIGSRESYGGNYGAFNRGGSNNGHTAHGSGIDPNLVNMTLGEIQRRQLAPGVPRNQQLHAVGKYQIIGETLRSLLAGRYGPTGVKSTDKFTPEVQEMLGAALARNRIVQGNVGATMRGLRSEWIGLQYAPDSQLRPAVEQLMRGGSTSAQFSRAAGGVSAAPGVAGPQRPGFGTPAASQGMADAQSRLVKAKQQEVALEEKLSQLNIEKSAFDLQEIARGKSQTEALTQQRNLEQTKLQAITTAGALSENEVERLLKRKEGEAQITAIYTARSAAVLQINEAVKAGKLTQDEANLVLKEINTGLEGRLATTRTQIALEQELLSIQQAQKLAMEAQNMQRQLMSTGKGIQAGYTGGAAGKYDQIYGQTGDAGLSGQFAQAQGVLDQLQTAQSDASALGGTIAGGFKEAIKAAATGGDIKAAFANMLGSLGEKFLDMAIKPIEESLTKAIFNMLAPSQTQVQAAQMQLQAAQMQLQSSVAGSAAGGGFGGAGGVLGGLGSLFGGGGGMWGATAGLGSSWGGFAGALNMPLLLASGGSTGEAQIVGERGPELFVPGQSGGITNHQNLRSLMASGGGGSKDGGGTTMNMSFETTQFMDREWVDRQQLETAMATASKQGAAQGERRALDRLRQSPRTRRSVGI